MLRHRATSSEKSLKYNGREKPRTRRPLSSLIHDVKEQVSIALITSRDGIALRSFSNLCIVIERRRCSEDWHSSSDLPADARRPSHRSQEAETKTGECVASNCGCRRSESSTLSATCKPTRLVDSRHCRAHASGTYSGTTWKVSASFNKGMSAR